MHVHFEPARLKVQYMHVINWDVCLLFVCARVLLTVKVVKIMANLQINADSPEDAELARFTPSFLWLLRDFYLTLEEDGRKVNSSRNCGLMRVDDSGMRPDPCREGSGVPCIFRSFCTSHAFRNGAYLVVQMPGVIMKYPAAEGILATAKICQMLRGLVNWEHAATRRGRMQCRWPCCAYPTRSTDNGQWC